MDQVVWNGTLVRVLERQTLRGREYLRIEHSGGAASWVAAHEVAPCDPADFIEAAPAHLSTEGEHQAEQESERVTCSDCGDPFKSTSMQMLADGLTLVCAGCLDTDYVYCYDREWRRTDACVFVASDNQWYPADSRHICFPNDTHEAALRVDCSRFGGYWYTQDWIDENTFVCISCDGHFHNDAYGGNGSCESCSASDDGDIEPADADATRLGFVGAPRDGFFYGVELEMECLSRQRADAAAQILDALAGHVIVKEDGSLDDGFEVVTRPATLAVHREKFTPRIFELAESAGMSGDHATCGLHVHVSRAPMSWLQIGKMQCFLHSPENAEFVRIVARRGSNSYAENRSHKTVTSAFKGEQDTRYTALNLLNAATVEFRIFKGTLKHLEFHAALEFCAALVRYCGNAARSIKEATSWVHFVAWLSRSQQRAEFPHLCSFLAAHDYDTGNKPIPEAYRSNATKKAA